MVTGDQKQIKRCRCLYAVNAKEGSQKDQVGIWGFPSKQQHMENAWSKLCRNINTNVSTDIVSMERGHTIIRNPPRLYDAFSIESRKPISFQQYTFQNPATVSIYAHKSSCRHWNSFELTFWVIQNLWYVLDLKHWRRAFCAARQVLQSMKPWWTNRALHSVWSCKSRKNAS
jgi:hypothetical protein